MFLSEDSLGCDFCVTDPATAGATNADALPTAVLVVNGVDSAVVVTVGAKVGQTGVYSASWTLPELAGRVILQLRATAVVGGVTSRGVVWQGVGGKVTLIESQADQLAAAANVAAAFETVT